MLEPTFDHIYGTSEDIRKELADCSKHQHEPV